MQSLVVYPHQSHTAANPIGTAQAKVTAAVLSADKLKVKLTVENPQVNKVYYVKVNKQHHRGRRGNLWNNEAWYTQLRLGPAEPTTAVRQVERFQDCLAASLKPGAGALELPFTAPYRVVLMGLDGRRHAEARGTAPGSLDLRGLAPGLYVLAGKVGSAPFQSKLRIPRLEQALLGRIRRLPGRTPESGHGNSGFLTPRRKAAVALPVPWTLPPGQTVVFS